MTERSSTNDDRMAPIVPDIPTRRVQTDGGHGHDRTTGAKTVLAETDAPLVPDLR